MSWDKIADEEILLAHALADGELSGEEVKAAERRLASSQAVRAEYETVTALKTILREKAESHPGYDAWTACRERISAIDRAKRTEGFVGRYAWAMCLVLFLTIVGAGALNRTGRNALRASEMAGDSTSLSQVPITSADASGVTGLLSRFFGRSPIKLEEAPLRVKAMMRGQIDGREAARLAIEDGRGQLSLTIVAGVEQVDGLENSGQSRNYYIGRINTFDAVGWTDRGFGMLLVGESRSPDDLKRIADLIRIN